MHTKIPAWHLGTQAARDAAMPPAPVHPYKGEKSPVDALHLSSIINRWFWMAQRDAGGAKKSRAVPTVPCGQGGSEVTVTTGSSLTSGCAKKVSGGKRRGSAGRNFLGRDGNHHQKGGFPKGRYPLGDTAPAPALWGQELFWDRATRVPASPTPPRTSAASGDVPLGVLQPPEEKAAERLKSVSGRAPLFGRGRSFF